MEISNYLKKAYSGLVLPAAEMAAKTRPWCAVESGVQGDSVSFGYLGRFRLSPKKGQIAPTPWGDIKQLMYWANLVAYDGGLPLDKVVREAAFTDPQSDYVLKGRQAIGIQHDEVVLKAAISDATYGKDKESTEDWSAFTDRNTVSHVIAAAGGTPVLSDIRKMNRIFSECGLGDEEKVLFHSPRFLETMLSYAEVGSIDYNAVRALYEGKVTRYGGFEWVETNSLYKNGTTVSHVAMCKGTVGLGIGIDQFIDVDVHKEMSYMVGAYFLTNLGAVRRDPERVIEYQTTEA